MKDFESIKEDVLLEINKILARSAGIVMSQNTKQAICRSLDSEKKHAHALAYVREQKKLYSDLICVSSPLNKYMEDYTQADYGYWVKNMTSLSILCFLETVLTSPKCDDHAIAVCDYTIKKVFDSTYGLEDRMEKMKETGRYE